MLSRRAYIARLRSRAISVRQASIAQGAGAGQQTRGADYAPLARPCIGPRRRHSTNRSMALNTQTSLILAASTFDSPPATSPPPPPLPPLPCSTPPARQAALNRLRRRGGDKVPSHGRKLGFLKKGVNIFLETFKILLAQSLFST